MKQRFLLIYIAFVLAVGIAGCYVIAGGKLSEEIPVHTIEINRLLVSLEENWDSVSSYKDKPIESDSSFDYSVIDTNGNVILYTRDDIAKSISSATSDYDVIRNIEVDGKVSGYLIVHNPKAELEKQTNMKIALFVMSLILLTVVISVLYYVYLKRRVLDPFKKLKGFAVRVAGGNLDTPLEMDKGNVFGPFTESFDIMREELKASREREEKAVKSRKELVAQLSHDIKTPVSSIKAMTDVMSLTASEEDKVTINAINAKADQIDSLISNLFHATLEELEQLEVKPEDINSTDIVQMIKDADYLNKIEKLDIKDAVVFADRLRLNQVLNNIIFNSYKYADTMINVTSRFENAGSKYLFIEIADKGPGVPEEELEMITQKFKRGSNAVNKDGSGLGLYISDYLMNKMEGSLTVRNTGDGFAVEIGIKIS
ncbi:MAG: HAMP domain-containing sensor histidine kinase [Eubacteriales bacterium]|nr:HAMP domain-containing sensor histidine kinase [Eubacteriales bacterium]